MQAAVAVSRIWMDLCITLLVLGRSPHQVLACDAAACPCRGFSRLPTATPLANLDVQQLILPPHLPQQQQQQQQDLQPPAASPTSGAAAAAADASIGSCSAAVLNTCSSEALAELLRHLKRAYWPFPWDTNVDDPEKGGRGSLGGFRWVVSKLSSGALL